MPVAAGSSNLIVVNEYYSGISYTNYDFYHTAFNGICAIADKLFWCITFNGKFLRNEVVDFWKNDIKRIMKKLAI